VGLSTGFVVASALVAGAVLFWVGNRRDAAGAAASYAAARRDDAVAYAVAGDEDESETRAALPVIALKSV
jgi:hypothetical protein